MASPWSSEGAQHTPSPRSNEAVERFNGFEAAFFSIVVFPW
jgi:hypothetical protein